MIACVLYYLFVSYNFLLRAIIVVADIDMEVNIFQTWR